MQIDWLTVSAQIVNFLLLVWLLKHFLYGPVIDAMDRRQQAIADNIADAQQREQTAQSTMEKYERKYAALEKDSATHLQQAEADAQQQRQQLMTQAREDVKQQRDLWQHGLKQEQQDYLKNLRKTSVKVIQDTGRKVLGELADTTLEKQIIEVFLLRLNKLDDTVLQTLKETTEVMNVISAFELDTDTKQKIRQSIGDVINNSTEIEFKVSSDLLCGISLQTDGYQVDWNMQGHLQQLDQQLLATLDRESESNA
ncbi:F0F1 ATP synthase subunit delta [Leucothrix arctica]|nr:F0F1 ATP synthase subunit delta [Leucothrix arctica]